MAYPLNDSDKMDEAKNNIVNILKMEGYKIDSGNLFIAFKEAGGEMSNFKPALDELTDEGKIKSDSDGNIMTVEDFQRKKSQESDNVEDVVDEENIEEEESETTEKNDNELESIIKLKEETDSWLIDKLKNEGSEEGLRAEVQELKKRVEKLEKIIENMTRAFD
jgi:vacuolar-type H+-ATPase subunit I/STV1